MIHLIGIIGHAGSGKDTFAESISSKYQNVYTEHFADPLKYAASHAFGIPVELFYDSELKEKIHPYWGISPRMIAQFMGTEMFRTQIPKLIPAIDNDFWVRRLQGRIFGELLLPETQHPAQGEYFPGDVVIIPDVRFQNEVNFIESNKGILIHVTRPARNGEVGLSGHMSEQLWNLKWDPAHTFLLRNEGTLNQFINNGRNLFNELAEKYSIPLVINEDSIDESDI